MRILIADDEYLVRASLKSMLEELNLTLDFVGEATNGEEMLALAGRHLPDIAFVDIRMPKLNGLEAIREGKSASPCTKWFILTGFPEFDYAREAIQLGVSGYLLKPVSPEELGRVVNDTLEENRKIYAAQNKQFERDLMALQYGLATLDFDEPGSLLRTSYFVGAVLIFDSDLPEKIKAGRQLEFGRALRECIAMRSEAHNRFALMTLTGGELASVGSWMPFQDRRAELQLRHYFQDLEQVARNSSDREFAITVLISADCSDLPSLQEQLERLQQLAPLRAVCGIGQSLHLHVLNEQAGRPGRLELSSLILNLSRSYQDRNYLNYTTALQHLERFFSKSTLVENRSLKKAVSDFIHCSMLCPLPIDQGSAPWIEILRNHGAHMPGETPKDEFSGADIIQQVIKFVDENYAQDIGLGFIAERLSITPNYLSTLFHKRTGINFMSYLKKVRLSKARELLNDPKIQVQQVAEQVGYLSPRHFSRLFAEQFGCLPSEYRDRLKK